MDRLWRRDTQRWLANGTGSPQRGGTAFTDDPQIAQGDSSFAIRSQPGGAIRRSLPGMGFGRNEMNAVHPMLTNIRALANPETWQKSIDLADSVLANWSRSPRKFERIYLVGHGSSFYNGQVGEYILEHIAGIPSKAIPAFAFSHYIEPKMLGPRVLVVGISTTGGTQSVCEALDR